MTLQPYFPANNMEIKFEAMQAGQVVSSRLRRSSVTLGAYRKDDLRQI